MAQEEIMDHHLFKHNAPLQLECGESLHRFQLNYCTLGKLNASKSNVIWVVHALTANAEADDWWEGLIGEGKLYDPTKHFIICVNNIGSCYGSSGPLDTNPVTQKLYLKDFPLVTIRDMVKSLDLLRIDLGIEKIETLIGGSMGGMQAVEWAISSSEIIQNLILLATNAKHSPWGIALNESQRMCLESDTTWKEHRPDAGQNGLRAARSVALVSYRNYAAYWNTQSETDIEKLDHYKASSYQKYQGDKLVDRFNAHSYFTLTKAMDSHHVGRERGGLELALAKITAPTLVIGISSDVLFPVSEQQYLAEKIPNAEYVEIDSFYGHDGFLIETPRITDHVLDFYKQNNIDA